jgi:hypothetical protein
MIVSGDLRDIESINERWFAPGSPQAVAMQQGRVRLGLIPVISAEEVVPCPPCLGKHPS